MFKSKNLRFYKSPDKLKEYEEELKSLKIKKKIEAVMNQEFEVAAQKRDEVKPNFKIKLNNSKFLGKIA